MVFLGTMKGLKIMNQWLLDIIRDFQTLPLIRRFNSDYYEINRISLEKRISFENAVRAYQANEAARILLQLNRQQAEKDLDQRREIVERVLSENKKDNLSLRKRIVFSGNKGGVGKTTLMVQSLGAFIELLSPFIEKYRLSLAGIEADLSDPQVGYHFSSWMPNLPLDNPDLSEVRFLNFFGFENKDRDAAELLKECLYPVPQFEGVYLAAIPENQFVLETLATLLGEGKDYVDNMYRLARGFRNLDADFVFADVRAGRTPHEVLSFWHDSDVRVGSHMADDDSIIPLVNLLQNSQRTNILHTARGMINEEYNGKIFTLEAQSGEITERIKEKSLLIENLDEKIKPLEEKIYAAEEERKRLNPQIREKTNLLKSLEGNESVGEIYRIQSDELKSLKDGKQKIDAKLKSFRKEITSPKIERNRYSAERDNLKERGDDYNARAAGLRATRDKTLEELKGLRSLAEIESKFRELNESGELNLQLAYSEHPVIQVPNIIKADFSHAASIAHDTIVELMVKEGFPTSNIYPVIGSDGKYKNRDFFIDYSGHVIDSRKKGIPIVFSDDEEARFSPAANEYRLLAWNEFVHMFKLVEPDLEEN
ncbi:hypothetical protein HYT56_02905 [Candidatus Woesearchaeota archaeon]|nr:hypothetical protein [Candidatus Woesearchaeota archaeon]